MAINKDVLEIELKKYLIEFKNFLKTKNINVLINGNKIICSSNNNLTFSFSIADEINEGFPFDLIAAKPGKLAAIIQSKLKLNKKIFARNCQIKKIDKQNAIKFLNQYHLMNSTQSSSNLGLIYKDELLAVASFSKGRKMNRLPENKRSYELIRFCCMEGITVTGGLTKLIKKFCKEKNAGDVMTYIDKQLSQGESFIKAGFKKIGETTPEYFLVNKKTFERIPFKNFNEKFDTKLFYLTQNSGNIKLVYTPDE